MDVHGHDTVSRSDGWMGKQYVPNGCDVSVYGVYICVSIGRHTTSVAQSVHVEKESRYRVHTTVHYRLNRQKAHRAGGRVRARGQVVSVVALLQLTWLIGCLLACEQILALAAAAVVVSGRRIPLVRTRL